MRHIVAPKLTKKEAPLGGMGLERLVFLWGKAKESGNAADGNWHPANQECGISSHGVSVTQVSPWFGRVADHPRHVNRWPLFQSRRGEGFSG